MLNQDGVSPDPEKTRAIALMPAPGVPALRRFLGMVNHLGKFSHRLSELNNTAFTLPLGAVPVGAGAAFGPILAAFTLHHGRKEPTQLLRRRLPVSRSRVVMAIRSLVPELACLSASSPPSSFKSFLTGRRRRASRHGLADSLVTRLVLEPGSYCTRMR